MTQSVGKQQIIAKGYYLRGDISLYPVISKSEWKQIYNHLFNQVSYIKSS